MNQRDRETIELLFDRISRVARRSGPRDRGAEALIQSEIAANPAAAYYMAQTIIMQERALNEAQIRIEELEGADTERRQTAAGPWEKARAGGGGSFLAGAAETAVGVTGGVLLGNMLADWLAPGSVSDDAVSGASAEAAGPEAPDDFGGFDLGDF